MNDLIKLNDCPPGLFLFDETLCFKSEYTSTLENPRRYQCDAYVVSSGEYFHGGAKDTDERGQLMVTPIPADRITAMKAAGDRLAGFAGHGEECFEGEEGLLGNVLPCTCGLTAALKQWKEASDGL